LFFFPPYSFNSFKKGAKGRKMKGNWKEKETKGRRVVRITNKELRKIEREK